MSDSGNFCYDFKGSVPGNSPFAPCVASDEPLQSCNCGIPDPNDLLVNGNIGSVQYINGEITLLGRGGVFNTAVSPTIMDNCDYRNYTPYVVGPAGPSLTADDPSEYATIQSAIDAAMQAGASNAAKVFVFIKPGTYNENLTLYPGVTLYADGLQGVTVVGSHNFASTLVSGNIWFPGDAFIAQNITFRQVTGQPIFTLTTSNTSPPPLIQRSTLLFYTCFIFQTDSNTNSFIVNVPGQSDVVTVALLTSQLVGTGSTFPGRTFITSGNGAVDFVMQGGGWNHVFFEMNSLGQPGAGGTFIFVGNSVKISGANLSESQIRCTSTLTTGLLRANYMSNDSSRQSSGFGIINVQQGCWQIVGNNIQNPRTLVFDGAATEGWVVGNTITESETIPLVELDNNAILYAHGNYMVHNAPNWIETNVGGGFYHQQQLTANTLPTVTVTPFGSNMFRVGSSPTIGVGITQVPAIMA